MKKIRFYIITAGVVLIPLLASAQTANQMQVGARPLGMGGAYSAIANDANAIHYNPAGIVLLQRQEITSMYGDLYGIGLKNSYVGYVFPFGDVQAFGVDWFHVGQGDNEISFRQDNYKLGYALRIPWFNVSIGAVMKMLDMDITLDGTSYAKTRGYGFDAGLIFSPFENLHCAVVGKDIGGTSVKHETDVTETIFKQQFRFGAAYSPWESFIVAADVDDRAHIGAEYWLRDMFALRGGIQKDLKKMDGYDRPYIYSAGFGLRYRFMQFDYAYEADPDLLWVQRFSITLFYNPALVSIKNAVIKPRPLFRSLYKKYSEEEFAEITLKNSSQNKLPVRVQIEIPTVTVRPYEEELVLEPRTTRIYPLKISLENEILAARGAGYDNLVQPIIKVKYEQDKNARETSRNIEPLYVLGKNKINWSVPERVAAFVTPEDEGIDRFARSIIQQYSSLLAEKYNNSNIGKATVLFDALGKHGIVYQADRQTPWYLIAADSSIFDNIQYPIELLRSRIGDCDDCTVLFASLLGNLNIDVLLLDVNAPGAGHIYLMFDSGISADEVKSLPYYENEYVIYNNRVWIPVETTMYGHSFSAAWRNGADEYQRRSEQGYIRIIDLAKAKMTYRAGQPPVEEIDMPAKEAIDELVTVDVDAYDTRIRDFALASGVSLNDPDGVYDAGAAYLRFNRLDDALKMFQRALELRPNFGDAINAVGVVYTKKSRYQEAMQFYTRAAELMPNDAGVRLNIAITYYLLGQQNDAGVEYQKAIEMDKTLQDLLKFIKPIKK